MVNHFETAENKMRYELMKLTELESCTQQEPQSHCDILRQGNAKNTD